MIFYQFKNEEQRKMSSSRRITFKPISKPLELHKIATQFTNIICEECWMKWTKRCVYNFAELTLHFSFVFVFLSLCVSLSLTHSLTLTQQNLSFYLHSVLSFHSVPSFHSVLSFHLQILILVNILVYSKHED